ncbi:MAG TPA: MBL fold metallo-hydrolase [Gemmatimonadaceae bacterium]
MFSVTYLGHQGWLVSGEASRILIDPLLTDEYSPGFRAVIYPPRKLELSKFPPIDAIILSHEHSDHVNLPSLNLLDRRIPVVFPERSARAMRTVIAQLGFRVVPAAVGDRFSIGDLTIRLLGGEHRDDELEEEWANLQILVTDRAGDGSFFSYVDGWPTEATLALIQRTVGRIGLFCHVNNSLDWSCLEGGMTAIPPLNTIDYAARIIAAEAGWWQRGDSPELSVICGPGFVFLGEDAWMNQILRADSERVCAALRALAPERAFRWPLPGETIAFKGGKVQRIAPRAPFLRALARAQWPNRQPRKPLAVIEEFNPACGQYKLAEDEWSGLFREIDKLASFLYGRTLFRTLHALDNRDLSGRKAAFALVLRCDDKDSAYVCEYEPNASRFTRVPCAAPIETYVAGLECWATDLWKVMDGQLLPQRLLGHLRTWSFSPKPLSPLQSVWRFFDSLHRPSAALSFYGKRVKVKTNRPLIRPGRNASKLKKLRTRAAG